MATAAALGISARLALGLGAPLAPTAAVALAGDLSVTRGHGAALRLHSSRQPRRDRVGVHVPRTLGGDGDPLDILVIGAMELRGAIAAAKIVAVMRMIDGGDPDDKLLAVLPGSPFDGKTLADLEAAGVTAILKTWFESYKGPGEIQVTGFDDLATAQQVLEESVTAYEASVPALAAGGEGPGRR